MKDGFETLVPTHVSLDGEDTNPVTIEIEELESKIAPDDQSTAGFLD
jgi:hypothetical protein